MQYCDILFWRHGECLDSGVLRGRHDSVPKPESIDAIYQQASTLLPPTRLISSPLTRSRALADRFADLLPAEPSQEALPRQDAEPGQDAGVIKDKAPAAAKRMEIFSEFAEMDFGDWDGKRLDSLWQTEPMEAWWQDPWAITPPGGETMVAFESRVQHGLGRLLDSMAGADTHERLWVVTHGGVIRCLMAALLGARRSAGFYNRLDIPCGACIATRWYRTAADSSAHIYTHSHTHAASGSVDTGAAVWQGQLRWPGGLV